MKQSKLRMMMNSENCTQEMADSAVIEAAAQLEIVTALAKLSSGESRIRVIHAVRALLDAESNVPGVMQAFLRGLKDEARA